MARKTQEDWNALFFNATQLFTPSSPVAETNLFAGRKVQIRKLCKSVAERGRHSILYGEPGVGKTSLAKLLRYFVPSRSTNRQVHTKIGCEFRHIHLHLVGYICRSEIFGVP